MVKRKKRSKFHTIHVIEKELRDHVVEWTATVLSVIGALLNAGLMQFGSLNGFGTSFYIWAVSNFLWLSFALKHRHWGVFVTFAIFLLINILSIVKNKLWLF